MSPRAACRMALGGRNNPRGWHDLLCSEIHSDGLQEPTSGLDARAAAIVMRWPSLPLHPLEGPSRVLSQEKDAKLGSSIPNLPLTCVCGDGRPTSLSPFIRDLDTSLLGFRAWKQPGADCSALLTVWCGAEPFATQWTRVGPWFAPFTSPRSTSLRCGALPLRTPLD